MKFSKNDIEEFLGRKVLNGISDHTQKFYEGKKILITGAAGSVGSEICRQLLKCHPQSIILFDQAESNLYELQQLLLFENDNQALEVVIGNVSNRLEIEKVFERYQPEVVFHAAAYKHVPMLEKQPLVAVKTNILGTKVLAELSVKYNVKNFIFVSTDKAINPSSVLGASKLLAEHVIREFKENGICSFVCCRFGNVLNSNGSVVRLTQQQIAKGGPVTITNPETTRYFMTIEESGTFLLEAGSIGQANETLFFAMGKPLKVLDLAKFLIQLEDTSASANRIVIKYVGLRPGEKLHEDIMEPGIGNEGTSHPNIFKFANLFQMEGIHEKLIHLENSIKTDNEDEVLQILRQTMRPIQLCD